MDNRLNSYLDRDLPRDDLTELERARADAFDARVGELRSSLNERAPADMDERVMRRITELGLEPLPAYRRNPARTVAARLWDVHETQLRWRPAYAFAMAALLIVALGAPWLLAFPRKSSLIQPMSNAFDGTEAAPIYVQFTLHADNASDVALAGSFNDWQPAVELQQTTPGVWTALVAMAPGVHDYVFVVDGERWVPDPLAPQVDDGFGGTNSRLTLLTPAEAL